MHDVQNEKKNGRKRRRIHVRYMCIEQSDKCRYTLFGAKRKRKRKNNNRTRKTTCMRKKASKNNKSQLLAQNS